MSLLDKIASPGDVKTLDAGQLDRLCAEIRAFLIRNVAHTGGHLASNLGVVELTVALHRVFDTAHDRLIFDVGHQCYTHKLLTGRRGAFSSLRSLGRMSGFPKPGESAHDAFATGHASTSVSAALGMARARTLRGEDYHVLAVLGDGSLTGGLAYEGLNDAGQSGEPLIVILNDNDMSIAKSEGAVARHLAALRTKPEYFRLKKVYHKVIDPLPGGKRVDRLLRRVKTAVKGAVLPGSMFENMGFYYLGPADGHDIPAVVRLLEAAKALRRPVLIHLVTKKGKGYIPSETNPAAFHGVARFDVTSGQSVAKTGDTFSAAFGRALCALAERDTRVCAVTAAMRDGVGLTDFAQRFPERFFDVGIAEAHAVTMAAGLAKQGLRPVCAVYSSFLQRSYDQIIHDVALQNLPVVFAIDRAGLVGEDGETHHGVFDPAFLSHIPNMTVWAPASFAEQEALLALALNARGPVALRWPRGEEGEYTDCRAETALLRRGDDLTLVTYGAMLNTALAAARRLAGRGIEVDLIKLIALRPLDAEPVAESLASTGRLAVLEDCVSEGSVGQRLLSALTLMEVGAFKAELINLGDGFVTHGSPSALSKLCGLDPDGVVRRIGSAFFPAPARAAR
ncbi:MAG: 1-deoxy-D-xylulose-5-phosphate synthase [Oscillospiraceae bacterium]|jgi:1-deoxy-D-xylulose-5-phosphate synthase|nr:1-deoxy-D-xylulose-5-phosphate synthase [Oscillospiraceae bacterium]